MINVLFIGMTSNHSGLETYTTNIFSHLQGKGFQFSFINADTAPLAYSQFIKNKGGKIYHVSMSHSTFKRRLTRYIVAKRFFKIHHNFDIVHINAMTINELYWAKAAKRCGIKHIIIQSHNSGAQYPSRFKEFLSKSLAFCNKIYANTHHNIIELAATKNSGKWMFGNNSSYKVVSIGMDTNPYRYNSNERVALKKKLGLNYNDKVIIITARLEKQKNYPKIIKTFNIMHKKDSSIKLVIIGKGSEKKHIKNMVHNFHLDSSTYFLGEISKTDVAKFLNIGDLSLIPSLCEAIPYSILEEQAAGVPVVASKATPNSSNVTGDVRFLSLNCSNYKWATTSLKLLNDNLYPENRIKMNDMMKNSKFSISSFINRIRNVYVRIINANRK